LSALWPTVVLAAPLGRSDTPPGPVVAPPDPRAGTAGGRRL